MKKLSLFVLILICCVSVGFSASYKNNVYQKAAREYEKLAKEAFDGGEYEQAVEYAEKASENAALSEAYIKMMLAKSDAEKQIKFAKNRIAWVESVHGDVYYPMSYSSGRQALDNAISAFDREDYEASANYAKEALAALAEIKEVTPLPQFYIVRPWAETKDCYWNISGRPYVYNNPTLWENLYQANKKNMKNPSDPDLIYPGMKMEIPSISGEYREGTYDSSKKYDAFNPEK